jgi:L-alanine-DL-glutamate epimerase-like enolase superfamily enzyme
MKLDPFGAGFYELERAEKLRSIALVEAVRDAVGPEVVEGYFALPAGRGLGVTLDEDIIRAHPRQQAHFNLFTADWHKRKAA